MDPAVPLAPDLVDIATDAAFPSAGQVIDRPMSVRAFRATELLRLPITDEPIAIA